MLFTTRSAIPTFAVILVLQACVGCGQVTTDVEPFEIVEVVPGVWAAIANDGGFGGSNAAIIDMEEIAIMFDSGSSPEAGKFLRETAKQLTGFEVGYLIVSHFHDDHIGGHQAFDGTSFVGTTATQRLAQEAGPGRTSDELGDASRRLDAVNERLAVETDPAARADLTIEAGDLGAVVSAGSDFRRTGASVTWDTGLTFSSTERVVRFSPTGHGHTEGHVSIFSAVDSLMFVSDLVWTDRHPYMGDSDPQGWMASLDSLLKFEFNILVPGHGPIGDRESVARMKEYLAMIDRAAVQAMEGVPVESIEVDSAFAEWKLSSRFQDNIRYVMAGKLQEDPAEVAE